MKYFKQEKIPVPFFWSSIVMVFYHLKDMLSWKDKVHCICILYVNGYGWNFRYGGTITNQIKRLGASCDWSRERFTLDDQLSRKASSYSFHIF